MKKIIAILSVVLMPNFVLGTMFPGTNGSVTSSTTIDLSTYRTSDAEVIIDVSSNITLTLKNNRGNVCFKIGSNTNIILDNAILDNGSTGACAFYIQGTGNTITLKNDYNWLRGGPSYPAIYVKSSGGVTINGDGKISAYGGTGAAAIGSNNTYESGSIVIEGNPKLIAYGGSGGAAIGGGTGMDATNITIKGGTITANAGSGGAAAIGGGGMKSQSGAYFAGDAENITITGGTITANGNGGGAGIGGGGRTVSSYVSGGRITSVTISGGKITATGGSSGGCGIGSGSRATSSLGAVNISGGYIVATGKTGGAGIGGGYLSSSPNITITGGEVFAEGSSYNSYVKGDDIGFGGDVSGGSSSLKISGNSTAVFARNNRWHSNKSITNVSYVDSKFDGLLSNRAYGYIFPAWNNSISSIATAYGYIKQYTAYFKSNGGNYYYKYDKVSPVEDITPPTTNPTRTGYTFSNWYKESSCNNLFVFSNNPISSNINIYAGWSPNEYEITFDINMGTSGSMANQTTLFDVATTLSKNEYQRTGYTFAGWNTKADGSGTSYPDQSDYTMKSEGATLYATWLPVTYTVSFDGNTNTGGSTADQIFKYDTPQNLNANGFVKTGYIFDGWNSLADGSGIAYEEGQNVNNLTTINDNTIFLYAQWQAKQYSILYHPDNGINDISNPDSYTIESEDILLAGATKEGYTFAGWYNDAAFSTQITTIPQGSTGDIELYAKFSPTDYSITYYLDNGSNNATNPDIYTIESEDIILADATKEGYTFTGWYSDAAFSTQITTIPQGSTGDIELYAKFIPTNCSITYYLDNGSNNAANPDIYTIESEDIILADATKEGYTFAGWYSDAAFSTQITTIPQGSTGDIELYAKYGPINYSITYHLNNGSNNETNPATYNVESDDISLADASKDHYFFSGWYTDANFSMKITTIPQGSIGEVEVYARFTPIFYFIEYYPGSGFNNPANPTNYNIESDNIILADAIKEGYNFLGWYNDANFSTQITTIPHGSTGRVKLYAKYSPTDYPITYHLDGGTNDPANPATYNVESVDISLADATKTGYAFMGWYTDANFTTQVTRIEQGNMGDIELYARYTANSYTVTFLNWDGEILNQQSVDYGTAANIPSDTIRLGYLFDGWFTDDGLQITNFSNITDNLTVSARYIMVMATENIRDIKAVQIYPNPVTSGKLYVKAYNEIQGIMISDILGRVVYLNSETAPTQIIDVSSWKSGIYFLRIANQTHKFIIK